MVRSTAGQRSAGRRDLALVGLTGALLSGIGDVLILGRSCSGRDFDQAAGVVPPHIDADETWRSLWNGAALPVRRIHAGTLTGCVGIGLLQWPAMRGMSRNLPAGRERRIAETSATAFAVAGVLTHQCCGAVILAYKKAIEEALGPDYETRRSPRSATPLLGISTAATLSALAAYSAGLTVAALRRRDSASAWQSLVTPLPSVMVTLLSFGALPAPVGGYARPASISIGLMTYFAITAASGQRWSDRRAAGSVLSRGRKARVVDDNGNDFECLTVAGVDATPESLAGWSTAWLLSQLRRPVGVDEWLAGERVVATRWSLTDTGRVLRRRGRQAGRLLHRRRRPRPPCT